MKILVAGGSGAVRNRLQATLEQWGHEVLLASDGQAAWQALEGEEAPRLAFVDWSMDWSVPGMGGAELCRRLHARQRDCPYLIAFTSAGDGAHLTETLEAEADNRVDDLLTRPLDPTELKARLRAGRRLLDLRAAMAAEHEGLLRCRARFRSMFDAIPEIVLVHDERGAILHVNDSGVQQLKWPPEDLLRMRFHDLVLMEEAEIDGHIQRAFAEGLHLLEARCRARDGRQFIARFNQSVVEFEGRPALISTGRDATERIQAEAERTAERNRAIRSERLLSGLIDSAQDAIIIMGADHDIKMFNRKAEKLFGYAREEMLGESFRLLIPLPDAKESPDGADADSPCLPNAALDKPMQVEGRRRDGSRVAVELSFSETRLGEENYLTAIVRDVTEKVEREKDLDALAKKMTVTAIETGARAQQLEETIAQLKQAQSQLLQSEKMAAIGQLAAGVAHEINNPVGFINSNLNTMLGYQRDLNRLLGEYATLEEAMEEALAGGPPGEARRLLAGVTALKKEIDLDYVIGDSQSTIAESLEGVERIKEIVAALKDFSRLDQAEVTSADINEGLESTLKIVWNELKYKTTVVKDFQPLPLLRCHPRQLNQVFMNLLMNAAQAIETKGEIIIATRAYNGGDPGIELRISDTGKGIPPENLRRIFEPFFTTKPVGKGTGLGLHITYEIIEKHGGDISVTSEVGRGSTFTIRLPLNGLELQEAEAENEQRLAS
jgi:PAS domain S-box-containing protein